MEYRRRRYPYHSARPRKPACNSISHTLRRSRKLCCRRDILEFLQRVRIRPYPGGGCHDCRSSDSRSGGGIRGSGGTSQSQQVLRRWAAVKCGRRALGIQGHIWGWKYIWGRDERCEKRPYISGAGRFSKTTTGGELDPWIGPGNLDSIMYCVFVLCWDDGLTSTRPRINRRPDLHLPLYWRLVPATRFGQELPTVLV